jgi:hypothetical protein
VALVERLTAPPQLLVFGSSRALKVNPAYLERKLGERGFNAAVSDGQPEDAFAFLSFIHSRFPAEKPHYLWLLDVEAFRGTPDPGVLSTPQLARFLSARERWAARLRGVGPLLSWDAARASLRVVRKEWLGSGIRLRDTEFAPNGFRARDVHDAARARGSSFAEQLRASEALYTRVYRTLYRRLDPAQKRFFERTLARMNTSGHAPVIVLTPIHPEMRRTLARVGWEERRRQVLAYLEELRPRYRFTLLDFTSLDSFGGSPELFYDGLHLTLPNVHRLLDAVVARERRAL